MSTELELVVQAQAGDPRALDRLLDSYRPLMLHRARYFLHDYQDAEDAVQDALYYAWSRFYQFDPTYGSLRPWLLTIVRHCAYAIYEKAARRAHLVPVLSLEKVLTLVPGLDRLGWLVEGIDTPAWLADSSHDPDQLIEATEVYWLLTARVHTLPKMQRLAFLASLTGVDYTTCARSLGIQSGSFKAHVSKAYHALGVQLRPLLQDHDKLAGLRLVIQAGGHNG